MRLRDREWHSPASNELAHQVMPESASARLLSLFARSLNLRSERLGLGLKGDRFIPTRSLMNLDFAWSSLTGRRWREPAAIDSSPVILTPKDEYRRRVEENLRLDSEGKPRKMLVFRGTPRNSKPSVLLVDEMMKDQQERLRPIDRIRHVPKLLLTADEDDHPTSVAWSMDAKTVAVGFAIRSSHHLSSRLRAHSEEVCGLKWSGGGNLLASGGNDNLVHVWESSKMGSSRYLHRFTDHCAAVRALAWCPFRSSTLASGGGTADQCIKIWNTQTGKCSNSINTSAQAIKHHNIPNLILPSNPTNKHDFYNTLGHRTGLRAGVEQA
ncbi:hypothetical protein BHE74_00040604 [Ensete ventricosum]|nr:hypothetical protein BHE74_00040604 [Ensete ventricosum]